MTSPNDGHAFGTETIKEINGIHASTFGRMPPNKAAPTGSLAQQLATYCADLSFDDLPRQVVTHAKHLILDLFGAALSGVDTPEAKAACRAINAIAPGGGPCTLWGTAQRASPAGAALANGIAAHARELDDFGGVDHSGAVVMPAIIAISEAHPPLSGRRFLESMIAGYEVGRRVLDAAGGYRPHNHADGWHSTGTCGSFAAAAASSKALDLSPTQSTWAMGLAGSFTGGTWAFSADGSMSKRYHAGRAAETGVICAFLAQSGFSGPTWIFEAEWGGFLTTYCRTAPRADKLLRNIGKHAALLRSGIKPYAACRDIHSTIDIVLEARRSHGLRPENIANVTVRCTPQMMQMVGKIAVPKTRPEAQLSLPYSVAVVLLTGCAFLGEYEEPFLSDARVRRLAERVTMVSDSELPFDSEPFVVITTMDGQTIEGHVEHASGAPQNPLTFQAIVDKFEALSSRTLTMNRVQSLKTAILSLETLDDMRTVTALLAN